MRDLQERPTKKLKLTSSTLGIRVGALVLQRVDADQLREALKDAGWLKVELLIHIDSISDQQSFTTVLWKESNTIFKQG